MAVKRSGVKRGITFPFQPGPTGRYAACPNVSHAPFAKQLERSERGCLWGGCVCGTRMYFPKKLQDLGRFMTKAEAIKRGFLIPDEME